jgi:hypothetical protein
MNTAEAIEEFSKRPDLEFMIAATEDLLLRVKGEQREMLTDLLPVLRAALARRNETRT